MSADTRPRWRSTRSSVAREATARVASSDVANVARGSCREETGLVARHPRWRGRRTLQRGSDGGRSTTFGLRIRIRRIRTGVGGDRPHPDWYHRVVRVRRRTAPHIEDEDRHQRAERGRARLGCAVRLSAAEWWCGSVDSGASSVDPGAEDALTFKLRRTFSVRCPFGWCPFPQC